LTGSRGSSAGKANYSLLSTRSFLKDLRKLDKADNRRILQTIELLKADPYVGKHLRGQLDGFRSLRVGDFRVIYTVEESTGTVILRAVGHRSVVYER
jgi:mRNA interferase RelE/StbE